MKTYKEKTYDISWERGREVLTPKSNTGEIGGGTMWARENYLNANKIKDAFRLSKDLNRSFGQVIGNYRRDNPDKAEDRFIFRESAPNVHDRIEDNIMQVITMGYISNVAKKAGRFSYSNCFPEEQSIAEVDRDSLFKYVTVKPSTAIYAQFLSIFGVKRFLTFSKIPVKVVENLNDGEQEIVKECAKSATKERGNRGRGRDKGRGKGKSRSRSKGKKFSKGRRKGRGKFKGRSKSRGRR